MDQHRSGKDRNDDKENIWLVSVCWIDCGVGVQCNKPYQAIASEQGSVERNQGAGRLQELLNNGPQISAQGNVQSQGRSTLEGGVSPQNENLEWFSLLGSVPLVAADTLIVTTADESSMDITGRAWFLRTGDGI